MSPFEELMRGVAVFMLTAALALLARVGLAEMYWAGVEPATGGFIVRGDGP